MSIRSLIKDAGQSRQRLLANPLATSSQVSAELANNVYPMLQAMLTEMVEVDEVVQEMIDQTESFIQPELAEQIFASIAAGGHLAKLVVELVNGEGELDDLRKKKLTDAVAAFETLTIPVVAAVNEAAVGDENGTDDEDEDEPENDEPDEDDETEEESNG